jgi:glucosyl-dolichyl phosphate glucuronosyltransferase
MDISVIICTYNRSQNLFECFDYLNKQTESDSIKWEIVLVDNNSTDDTKGVADQLECLYPSLNLRYLFEAEQGLSAARNRGIREAKGSFLIFIDDDIRVTPVWLKTISSTFKKIDCDAVGGRIHVESPDALPKWITPEMYGFLGHQDFGSKPHPMDGITEFPFGGNMAVNRRVIDLIGYFDVDMGRKGEGLKKEELYKGEETDFFNRLAQAGGKFYYHPDALVYHKILPHQLQKRFFLILHYNAGKVDAIRDKNTHKSKLYGVPLFILPQFFRSIVRYLKQLITVGPDNSFRQLMNVYYFWGMIVGYYSN